MAKSLACNAHPQAISVRWDGPFLEAWATGDPFLPPPLPPSNDHSSQCAMGCCAPRRRASDTGLGNGRRLCLAHRIIGGCTIDLPPSYKSPSWQIIINSLDFEPARWERLYRMRTEKVMAQEVPAITRSRPENRFIKMAPAPVSKSNTARSPITAF